MRAVLIAVALAIVAPQALAAPLSKAECAKLAASDEQLAAALRRNVLTTEAGPGTHVYDGLATGPILEKGQATRAARLRFVESMKAYATALEDLAYQLRVCAR